MKKLLPGVLAGIAAAVAGAAPAVAAPAGVTVRVEGTAQTFVAETPVTVDAGADVKQCPATSALAAFDTAVGGDWSGTYYTDFSSWIIERIRTETRVYPGGSWAFWINERLASTGACTQPVQQGDSIVFAPAEDGGLLTLDGVPATVAPGQAVAVKVTEHAVDDPLAFPPVTETRPADGATVSYGGATATVGADGIAQLTFTGSGPVGVQATEPGHVRSPARTTCVTTGVDGACGTARAGGPSAPPEPVARDTTAPTPAFAAALRDGRVFARGRAPRELSGTVSADPSGLTSVRLSIARRSGGRCWTFRGETERFKRHGCGGAWYFKLGDRADWSYLLPAKLPRGRYTIGVMATDKAFNASRTEIGIRVR